MFFPPATGRLRRESVGKAEYAFPRDRNWNVFYLLHQAQVDGAPTSGGGQLWMKSNYRPVCE